MSVTPRRQADYENAPKSGNIPRKIIIGTEAVKFAILVKAGPFSHQAAASALAFAQAVLDCGHELVRVFFYCDGVHTANRLAAPSGDENNLVRAWSRLAAERDVELVVCITAGMRRGVREANLAPGFRISGLGQLVEAAILADRLITFGA